ncbi:hypothetical protein CRUP_035796 [Coryphaenoides rupestris]|nr:hypothetical protein CRUP_035796 [Coryphaenoides rupestris]
MERIGTARSERYHHLETEEEDTNDEDFNQPGPVPGAAGGGEGPSLSHSSLEAVEGVLLSQDPPCCPGSLPKFSISAEGEEGGGDDDDDGDDGDTSSGLLGGRRGRGAGGGASGDHHPSPARPPPSPWGSCPRTGPISTSGTTTTTTPLSPPRQEAATVEPPSLGASLRIWTSC